MDLERLEAVLREHGESHGPVLVAPWELRDLIAELIRLTRPLEEKWLADIERKNRPISSRTVRPEEIDMLLAEVKRLRAGEDTRDSRQRKTAQWCAAAFGADHAASITQRGIRLAEEAIEAAQAAGCDPAMVHKLVDHVYSKPPGNLAQEIGGIGVTVLALAEAAGLSADSEEACEVSRVLSKPLSHFAARNKAKNDAGFNVVRAAIAEGE
jgi:hypothetical protein